MTRKKVKLAWIANASARRTSLKKRRLGLLKKVNELTTLCGVDACLIVYSPGENEPIVWPSHIEVQQQLEEFYKMPELERLKKTMNQESYLIERVTKSHEQLRKYQTRNKEVEMGHLMHQINQGKMLDEFNLTELHGLIWLMEEKMKEIHKRIDFFQHVPFETSPAQEDLSFSFQGPRYEPMARTGDAIAGDTSASLGGDGLLLDQWFIDMIKTDEFKSGTSSRSMVSDMGLPCYHPFDGSTTDNLGSRKHSSEASSSSDAAVIGVPSYGNFRGDNNSTGAAGSDMGLPPFEGKTWPSNFPP